MQCVSNNTVDNIQGLWILINLKIRKKHNLMSWVEAKTMLGIPEFSFSVSVFMFLYLFDVCSSTLHVFFSIFYFFSQCSLYSSLAPSQLIQQLLVSWFNSSWSADSKLTVSWFNSSYSSWSADSRVPGQLIQSSRLADSTAPTAPGRPIQEFLVSWFKARSADSTAPTAPGCPIQEFLVSWFNSSWLADLKVPAWLLQQSLLVWFNSPWSTDPTAPGQSPVQFTLAMIRRPWLPSDADDAIMIYWQGEGGSSRSNLRLITVTNAHWSPIANTSKAIHFSKWTLRQQLVFTWWLGIMV